MTRLHRLFVRFLLAALIVGATAEGLGAQDRGDPPAATAEAVQSEDYLIGTGDTLQVFVWNEPSLSVIVPVRPDGRVSTPLIEDIVAAGKTPTQLAREMEKVLSEFIRSPQVNVIPQKFVGTFASQIRVLGQATKPGAVPYREGITLLDVIIEVGGLTKFAAGNRAKLVRTVDGQSHEQRVKVDDLVNRGRLQANVAMRPGDVVIIPEARF